MSGRNRPLTCKEVKQILVNLGFALREGKGSGTSHEQWIKDVEGGFLRKACRYKVTVDCPKAPFSQDLIGSMARQAGVSKKDFYAALDRRK